MGSLLFLGIRSDTHMLALAYGGELCYWCLLTRDRSQGPVDGDTEDPSVSLRNTDSETRWSSESYSKLNVMMIALCGADFPGHWARSFDPLAMGVELLTKYIEIATGPLKLQSWNCDRSRELLKIFQERNSV